MKKSFNTQTIKETIERLKKAFPNLRQSKLDALIANYDKLAFPQHPNWAYCLPILPNITLNGKLYDLGVHFDEEEIMDGDMKTYHCFSHNAVISNEGPDYISGFLRDLYYPRDKALVTGLVVLGILTKQDLAEMLGSTIMAEFMASDLAGRDLIKFIEGDAS